MPTGTASAAGGPWTRPASRSPAYLYRAVDEHGQVVDVYYSERRDRAAAEAFFRGALQEADVRPRRVSTDRAAASPPALAAALPGVEHLAGTAEQQAIERDHQHPKGRSRCVRGFQAGPCAAVSGRARASMRNLRDGFYRLGPAPGGPRLPQRPRLALAWGELTAQLVGA